MISDWIYPETDICFACGDYVEGLGRARFCTTCRRKLHKVEEPLCQRCGKPIADGELCQWCGAYSRSFDRAFSPYRYEGLARDLILACKYKNHPELARAMGQEMAGYFCMHYKGKAIDCIVPVPIHRSRYRDRGYNQAGLIASEIGHCLDLPIRKDWLVRREATKALKEMTAADRKASLKGAFALRGNEKGQGQAKRILLVDDVLTTGATAEACAKTLQEDGLREIIVLTFATRG